MTTSRGEVSPYDWMVWPDGALEAALAQDVRRRDVVAYLSEREYATLAPLARAAAHAARDPERVAYLIPGIMGSQLGLQRNAGEPPDLLWLDPMDLQRGRLMDLSLDAVPSGAGSAPIISLGAMPYSYLALKLRLEAAGFTVRWADYDWRLSIEDNGARLAARLTAEPARRQYLVGHSLGGLVARAALAASDASIERLVTLGTPHGGSFAALQALRASYITVRRIAQLDPSRSAEQLAESVFASFPSLYQMLPARCGTLNLRDLRQWPDSMPRPRTDRLRELGIPQLPWNDGRSHCIAGSGFDTVARVTVDGRQFRYHITRDGDGTVPCESAAPTGQPVRYASTMHGELPRDAAVAQAVIDLLDAGRTQALFDSPPNVPAGSRSVLDSELQSACRNKLDWATLSSTERRDWFARMNQAIAAGSPLEPSA